MSTLVLKFPFGGFAIPHISSRSSVCSEIFLGEVTEISLECVSGLLREQWSGGKWLLEAMSCCSLSGISF
jgi:hypothetical protein